MGFESKISGYIASHIRQRDEKSIAQIEALINALPNLENDKWPFLPKDIFSISKPISKQANPVPISYKSTMIHFSMSVKQIDDHLEEWLKKFELFFKQIPEAYEVNVDVHLSPFTTVYRNGYLNYYWKSKTDSEGIQQWSYKGDPTTIEEINNPINFAHAHSIDETKNKVVENMQWLSSQKGKLISITDKITTNKGNYDRHSTRTNQFETRLNHFSIRTSGAIGMIEGENLTFEFKTDAIIRIERKENTLEIESVLGINTSRLIKIEVKN